MKQFTIKKLGIFSIISCIINIILTIVHVNLSSSGAQRLDGSYLKPNSIELIIQLIKAQAISTPILCLFLGAITTFFIEKEKPYKKRYFKGFLLTLSVVYGILIVITLIKLRPYIR
tara:strand:- start:101 stop:448 length:348 start_codon:yes stop_codon:yes gene_type:complete